VTALANGQVRFFRATSIAKKKPQPKLAEEFEILRFT
jgi:hypothetical protein